MRNEELKIRCSALGRIMVDAKLPGLVPLTETKAKRLKQCLKAQESGKMTESMKRDLAELIKERDTPWKPELSKGAKTEIENMWYQNHFEFNQSFTSKQTRKGTQREADAIKQIAEYLGIKFAIKNETFFENDFIMGTPDLLTPFVVFDVKCPWEPKGLDLFSDKLQPEYKWQTKGYQWLAEINQGSVIRILMNPPESEIYSLALPHYIDAGNEYYRGMTIPEDFIADVREMYNFEKKPVADRIKILNCDIEENDVALIKQQVGLMREHWQWCYDNAGEVKQRNEETKLRLIA